ncbi:MAG TPA: archease [Actinomycetota bacterium]|nr:archease [Actinomycetota bacterium]
MGEYRIIEHTADIGIYVGGESLEELFRQGALGLLAITGTWKPGTPDEQIEIEVGSHDLPGTFVDWLGEVLYLQDTRDAWIVSVEVSSARAEEVRGRVGLKKRGKEEFEGTPVKAITYHQLEVEQTEEGWEGHVFFDI